MWNSNTCLPDLSGRAGQAWLPWCLFSNFLTITGKGLLEKFNELHLNRKYPITRLSRTSLLFQALSHHSPKPHSFWISVLLQVSSSRAPAFSGEWPSTFPGTQMLSGSSAVFSEFMELRHCLNPAKGEGWSPSEIFPFPHLTSLSQKAGKDTESTFGSRKRLWSSFN